MIIIGITGGIGAGKSSVSGLLAEMGAEVIDADLISHQVVEIGKPAYKQILHEFGPHIVKDDGALDRKKLADLVFQQPMLRKKLESIVHAEVVHAMLERIDFLRKQGYKGIVVLDVPIPVKYGFQDTADIVWVVTASEAIRIKRIMSRNGLTHEEAKHRIDSQMPQAEYISLGDEIIVNEGTFDSLREQVKILLQKLPPKV